MSVFSFIQEIPGQAREDTLNIMTCEVYSPISHKLRQSDYKKDWRNHFPVGYRFRKSGG